MKKTRIKPTEKKKLSVKKNDSVRVIAGKNLGKKGKVLKVFPEKNRIIVEGVNFIKKAQRPTQRNQKGGIIEKEAPIAISNVMVVCTRCSETIRIKRSVLPDGKRIRVCRKCGEVLDK